MQSKKSLFNKTLYKKNLTRLAPVWVVYFLLMGFLVPVYMLYNTSLKYTDFETIGEQRMYQLYNVCRTLENGVAPWLLVVFGLVTAWMLFGYLYQSRSAYMMHAFPVTRKELYATGIISGLTILWAPSIVLFLLTAVLMAVSGLPGFGLLLVWLLYVLSLNFVFFAFGVFSCLLVGHVVAAPFAYAFCMIGVDCVRLVFRTFTSFFTYGLSIDNNFVSVFSPLLKIMSDVGLYNSGNLAREYEYSYDLGTHTTETLQKAWFTVNAGEYGNYCTTGEKVLVGYIVFSILLLVATWFIYKYRQMEVVGDVVATGWLRPVFRWLVAFCGAMVFADIVVMSVVENTFAHGFALYLILALIFGLVFFYVAEAMIQKKAKVFGKKFFLGFAIYAVCNLVLFGCVKMDVAGVESYVPEASEVEMVTCSFWQTMDSSNPKLIQDVIDSHQEIIDAKSYVQKELIADPQNYDSVSIRYQLKDGRNVNRYYYIPNSEKDQNEPNSLYSILVNMENQKDYRIESMFDTDGKGFTISGGYIEKIVTEKDNLYYETMNLSAEQSETLYQAVLKDLESGAMRYRMRDEGDVNYANGLYIEYYVDGNRNVQTAYIEFNKNCRNTLEAVMSFHVISEDDLVTYDEYNALWDAIYEE